MNLENNLLLISYLQMKQEKNERKTKKKIENTKKTWSMNIKCRENTTGTSKVRQVKAMKRITFSLNAMMECIMMNSRLEFD